MTQVAARRVVASSSWIVPDDHLDIVIHALAQLPDRVALDVYGDGPDRPRLETLTRAYAIEDRVAFRSGAPSGGTGVVVYPSAQNAASAPVRPESSLGRPIVLDPTGRSHDGAVTARTMAELLELLSRPGDPPAACRRRDGIFFGHRVAVVTNLPAHYRIPLLNGVASRLAAAGASLRIFFLAGDEPSRPWMRPRGVAFEHEFLRSAPIPLRERRSLAPLDLQARLRRFQPTTVLVGGFSPFVAPTAARYAASGGVPFGVWSGEIASTRTARSRLRTLQRRWIAARAAFAISYGFESGEYLRELRGDLPVVYGRNTSGARMSRARPRYPEMIEALVVADLASQRKGVDVLIEAVRLAPSLACRLTVIGGGRLLPSLVAKARGDPRIRFVGPLPSDRVLDAYRRSDVFLFPSREDVFGLVLAEAMGSGLATIVSNAPGAVADLAVPQKNCLVVESHDPHDWANALSIVVADHELRLALGGAAARTIQNRWTMDHSADALIAGLRLGVLRATAPARSRASTYETSIPPATSSLRSLDDRRTASEI